MTCGSIPQPEPLYLSNAKEADQQHVTNCSTENVLVYSPDTDVYTIGMSLSTVHNSKQVTVQLNPLSSHVKRYININNLVKAISDDHDLSSIPVTERTKVIMSFVCTL